MSASGPGDEAFANPIDLSNRVLQTQFRAESCCGMKLPKPRRASASPKTVRADQARRAQKVDATILVPAGTIEQWAVSCLVALKLPRSAAHQIASSLVQT